MATETKAAKATAAKKADQDVDQNDGPVPAEPDAPSGPVARGANSGPTAEEAVQEAEKAGHVTGERPNVTRAEGEVPGTVGHTAPGDAPADTTDPREVITTATPSGAEMAKAAREGHGSVVAYAKIGEVPGFDPDKGDRDDDRYEEYDATVNPLTGETVRMRRNLRTGRSWRIEGEADQGTGVKTDPAEGKPAT